MSASAAALAPGFADPVHDAQRAFRAALDALSRPGQRVRPGDAFAGVALGGAMARLLLALTDQDTAVWWCPQTQAAAPWLRFHTGAGLASEPGEAAFACAGGASLPALHAFAQGTAQAPEFSTTLLIELPGLEGGPALQWHGPGILDSRTVRLEGLPDRFWTGWQANHAAFPLGVDVIFTCGQEAIGLPRTTRVGRIEGI